MKWAFQLWNGEEPSYNAYVYSCCFCTAPWRPQIWFLNVCPSDLRTAQCKMYILSLYLLLKNVQCEPLAGPHCWGAGLLQYPSTPVPQYFSALDGRGWKGVYHQTLVQLATGDMCTGYVSMIRCWNTGSLMITSVIIVVRNGQMCSLSLQLIGRLWRYCKGTLSCQNEYARDSERENT